MSGPLRDRDTGFTDRGIDRIEVKEGRPAEVGGLAITRVLPTKGRRTVGPWCFVDLMNPGDALSPDPMEVGPHPHIGLATVTWLFSGEALHGDSLGTEQLIRPGELNLMTSGHGIAHAELGMGRTLSGAQMWVALPEATRHGGADFEHHADLPQVSLDGAEVTLVMGTLGGVASPARRDWPIVGAEMRVRRGSVEVPVDPDHEHCVVPIDHPVLVGEAIVEPGWLGLVPAGVESVRLETRAEEARAMLLGGAPLGERVQMWWNFVARTRDELTAAWRAWAEGDEERFGPVPSTLERMEAPVPPWVRG